MSLVINISHSSRTVEYLITMPAGVTTWSFRAEYSNTSVSASLTNCTSLLVNGSAFVAGSAITKDTYYTVSVTPTDYNSQCVISITTRLNANVQVSANAVNFNNSLWNGNKLYALTDTQLFIFDATKFNASNYLGSGQYTVSPYVETITLPSMPTNTGNYQTTSWQTMCFVKHKGGEGKILIFGRTRTIANDANAQLYGYGFYFDIATKGITSLTDVSDQITANTAAENLGYYTQIMYDYSSEIAYVCQINSNSGATISRVQLLSTNTYGATISDFRRAGIVSNAKGNDNYFNPFATSFSRAYRSTIGISSSNPRGDGFFASNYAVHWFNALDGYYYTVANNGNLYKFDSTGSQVGSAVLFGNASTNTYVLNSVLNTMMQIDVQGNTIAWIKINDTTKKQSSFTPSDILSGQTSFQRVNAISNASECFFTAGYGTGNTRRLFAVKPNTADLTTTVMYYDLPTSINVNSLVCNQLKL